MNAGHSCVGAAVFTDSQGPVLTPVSASVGSQSLFARGCLVPPPHTLRQSPAKTPTLRGRASVLCGPDGCQHGISDLDIGLPPPAAPSPLAVAGCQTVTFPSGSAVLSSEVCVAGDPRPACSPLTRRSPWFGVAYSSSLRPGPGAADLCPGRGLRDF